MHLQFLVLRMCLMRIYFTEGCSLQDPVTQVISHAVPILQMWNRD